MCQMGWLNLPQSPKLPSPVTTKPNQLEVNIACISASTFIVVTLPKTDLHLTFNADEKSENEVRVAVQGSRTVKAEM